MTRPTSLAQTSPSTEELGPFLNSAVDCPQSGAGSVCRLHPPTKIATQLWLKIRTSEYFLNRARRRNLEMANTQKTAIVTGGSQGIGAGLVKAFLSRGYNVVANSRNISRSGAFEPSDNLALIDGDI